MAICTEIRHVTPKGGNVLPTWVLVLVKLSN